MPAPTIYTEQTLAAFMHDVLSLVAPILDLTLPSGTGSYTEAVNETVLAYHGNAEGTIAEATNIIKLRALARREAWRLATDRAVALYDAASEDQKESLGQVHKMAKDQLEAAAGAADLVLNPPSSGGGGPQNSSGAVRTVVDW